MRVCFLHIGVYKTGSSSIQWALYSQRAALAERGYLYPASGVVPALFGHHNIAAEIVGTSLDAALDSRWNIICCFSNDNHKLLDFSPV
jgi:hypothetical protein